MTTDPVVSDDPKPALELRQARECIVADLARQRWVTHGDVGRAFLEAEAFVRRREERVRQVSEGKEPW